MKKLITVLVLAILAISTSLDVAAQNNFVAKDVSKMTLVETHAVVVRLIKEKLSNIAYQIGECKNEDCEKKLWAESAAIEEELESSQVVCPKVGDWDYSGGRKNYRQGIVKNYNEGETNIAVMYFFNMDCLHNPVIITLGSGEEKHLSLDRGLYQIVVTCGFYNKLFQSEIRGNDWLVSSITSASKFGIGDIYKMEKTAE